MIYWAPLLHFYQPPAQTYEILERVCNESYRPLMGLISQEPVARVTVNICGVLTEMLVQHCMEDVVSEIRKLAEEGKIELTGSAKYHPIMPLIPQEEMLRQIELNLATNRRYLGEIYHPRGFFLPEMAYGKNVLTPILKMGYDWLLLSGIACPVEWPTRIIYQTSEGKQKLAVFFRDDILSNKISFQSVDAAGFIDSLRNLANSDGDIYVITAMDAETFGHHVKDWENLFLRKVLEAVRNTDTLDVPSKSSGFLEIKLITISQLTDIFPKSKFIDPYPSSWSTSKDDIGKGIPYPLWDSGDNPLHTLQWQLLNLAIELTNKAVAVSSSNEARFYANEARQLLDEAEHSCPFWWASKKPVRNLSLISRAVSEQSQTILNAYQAIKLSNIDEKERIEAYYRVVTAFGFRDKIIDALIMS